MKHKLFASGLSLLMAAALAGAFLTGCGPSESRTGTAQQTLPRPEPEFKGKMSRTAKDSTPDFPKEVQAPQDAPNILLIMTDDVGFAAPSTFEIGRASCRERVLTTCRSRWSPYH